SYKVISEKKPLVVLNFKKEQDSLPTPLIFDDPRPALSWIGVPLMKDEQVIGIINIQSFRPYAWNEEDLQLFFTIVDQISAVIAKARLYESVQQELNERKKAEEAKKDLEIRLRQAQKMEAIGTLAGGIAHDFNNVLYPIIGYAEMGMDMAPEGSEINKNLNEILVAAERARDLVNQILTFSRQQEIKPRSLEIQSLLKEALKLIRAVIPSNISMIQNIDEHCGPILADPSQIHQIIMNLCTNAYYAMRQQGGVLEISLAEVQLDPEKIEKSFQGEPGLYLCLTVCDTGNGMDPGIIERIFDPYFTTKPPGEGTGMGLAMVHGIVKNYGGEITVNSKPGQGSVFKVYLPCVHEKIIETEIQEKKTRAGQGERVFFIDDEDQVIRMVKQMLERLGYTPIVQKDSVEALEAFRKNPDDYDLVITDQTMPKITGVELSKELLKIRADIPIILCTGYSEIVNEEQAQAAGIRKFIMKPIAKKALAQIIRETLDESSANDARSKKRDCFEMEKMKKQ
ncbi:MAG: response regulator, partial [Desulfobacteraceae bacterium]